MLFTELTILIYIYLCIETKIAALLEPDSYFLTLQSDQKQIIISRPPPNEDEDEIEPFEDTIKPNTYYSDEQWVDINEPDENEQEPSIPPMDYTIVPKNAIDQFSGNLTKEKKARFTRDFLPTKVQLQLQNPFGKDNLFQCFMSQPVFRHIWIPLTKSGFLSNLAKKNLAAAMPEYRTLLFCFRKYSTIDFSPLRNFNPKWNEENDFVQDRIDMTTAALLHYDGDIASVVRYVGGVHTYADINVPTILANLKPILTPDIWNDLERVYTKGCPSQANIQDTENNYQAYRKFGNHKPAEENAPILKKALVKTSKRSLMLMADDQMADFCPNVKFSPLSVVDVDHRYRKPRPITDCTARPEPWCDAVNDWTSSDNEPAITFGEAWLNFLVWNYNLAITYPLERKCTARDDIQNAFPRLKHYPNIVGMYSTKFFKIWCINIGQTFGENTSPASFDVLARARNQASQYRWYQPTVLEDAKQYIPVLPIAQPLTLTEQNNMTKATADTTNKGVLDNNGNRLAPPFNHHVDDNMYSDIASEFPKALSASILGAYDTLGYPQKIMQGPEAIEWTKFLDQITHIDEPIGYGIDLHRLKVYLPLPKRAILCQKILPWITTMACCTLRDAAELIGSLIHAVQTNPIAKARFFGLQNMFRYALRTQYHKTKAWYTRSGKAKYLSQKLPRNMHRLEALVSKDMATTLWNTKATTPIRQDIKDELQFLYDWLKEDTKPWEIPIGHLIPRDTTIQSTGDASEMALGAFNHHFQFWFGVMYGPEIYSLIKASTIHINALEFTANILQIAAYIVFTESPALMQKYHTTNPPLPQEPVLSIQTDNQVSQNWTASITSKSESGQNLVILYSLMLERSPATKIVAEYLPGELNVTADVISRPPAPLTNPPVTHFHQIYQTKKELQHYLYFQPSPELLSNLCSLLRSKQKVTPIFLPKNLGQFSQDGTTISYSVLK